MKILQKLGGNRNVFLKIRLCRCFNKILERFSKNFRKDSRNFKISTRNRRHLKYILGQIFLLSRLQQIKMGNFNFGYPEYTILSVIFNII